jgi:serine/threonine-protein kinase HipA
LAKGKVLNQFYELGKIAGLIDSQITKVFNPLLAHSLQIERLTKASFLSEKIKRNYFQAYQTRLKKLNLLNTGISP